jgi:hypothetical protein
VGRVMLILAGVRNNRNLKEETKLREKRGA